jgi:signal transduction histidine kinase
MNKLDKQTHRTHTTFWRSSTLRMIALIVLPITLFSVVIAVGSVIAHREEMRLHLTEDAWKIATDPILELTLVAPLVLIPPLLFAIAALWFVARQIILPLQKLESQAVDLAWGKYETIMEPVGGIPEVQHLQMELVDMSQKLKTAQDGLHDYIGAITSAQEDERNRLARELHDDTIQAVIALKQRVHIVKKSTKAQKEHDALSELETLASETIENLRRLTRALRPIYLEDLGLVTALEMLARETSENHSLVVDFRRTGDERRLPHEVELSLYRIMQEALNNAAKHSHATKAWLNISFKSSEIQMEVSDNGGGFTVPISPTEFAPNGHFGLLGMHERADLIGAKLEIESALGEGTKLMVLLENDEK